MICILQIFSATVRLAFKYIFFYLFTWEREICCSYLFMHSLVDSCICPDWESNPQPFWYKRWCSNQLSHLTRVVILHHGILLMSMKSGWVNLSIMKLVHCVQYIFLGCSGMIFSILMIFFTKEPALGFVTFLYYFPVFNFICFCFNF